jgi:Protein of unknown function (DUF3592)
MSQYIIRKVSCDPPNLGRWAESFSLIRLLRCPLSYQYRCIEKFANSIVRAQHIQHIIREKEMKVIATPKYVFTLVKYVFILVGIGLLVGAFSMYKNTSSFVTEASRAEGTVVDFQMSRRGRTYSPMSRRGRTYSPIIHFISQEGKKVEFISSVGTNPPSYSKGQKVEVLYQPTEPQNAKINGFSSLWASSVILGGLGGIFFMIGTSISLEGRISKERWNTD